MLDIAENLAAVRERMAQACRDAGRAPDAVTLIAVSKRQPDDRLVAAYEAGQRDFGENFVQELVRKRAILPTDARWHLIGHLQTNKAKQAVGAHLIHTVDSMRVAKALDKAAAATNAVQRVLIEVNLAAEPSKAGVAPDDVFGLADDVRGLSHVQLEGLMAIPPIGEGRRHFAALRSLKAKMAADGSGELSQLSMGMSADYPDAIAEGSTIVRVGTAIFGARAT